LAGPRMLLMVGIELPNYGAMYAVFTVVKNSAA
jgi:hypothetical protein